MSVVIKGMEMPEDCFSCPLKEEGYCNLTNAYATEIHKRDKDCPLYTLDIEEDPWIKAAYFENEYDDAKNVGWMSAMCAVMVRIQRGYTIDQLKEYVELDQNDYANWFNKKINGY